MRSNESPLVRTCRLLSEGRDRLRGDKATPATYDACEYKSAHVTSACILIDHLQQLVVHRLSLIF
jgi:hypothetical protein